MARTNFPKKVQREAIERAAGRCEGLLPTGERCPCELQPGRFQVDHILMDALGGLAILANAQVLCTDCHKQKTDKDKARLAKAKRQSDAHNGVADPNTRPLAGGRPLEGGKPLPGAAPAKRATAPLTKQLPPRRALYVSEPRR